MKFTLVLSLVLASSNVFAADSYMDLSYKNKKALVNAVNDYMVPYANALRSAHVDVVLLLNKCMESAEDLTAYPADLLQYDENSVCHGDKKLLKKFNKIWEDTDPGLPETEYRLYRGYQTLAELGHEAHGAGLMASWSTSMIKNKNYKFETFGKMIGEFRHDYDGYINADMSPMHFTRGDGCFLEVLIGIDDENEGDVTLAEICS